MPSKIEKQKNTRKETDFQEYLAKQLANPNYQNSNDKNKKF